MPKDLEYWVIGAYDVGLAAFVIWFLRRDGMALRLLGSLGKRPFGSFLFPLVVVVYCLLWPMTLMGLGLWCWLIEGRRNAVR